MQQSQPMIYVPATYQIFGGTRSRENENAERSEEKSILIRKKRVDVVDKYFWGRRIFGFSQHGVQICDPKRFAEGGNSEN
jgi:hypothetical protein